MSNSFLVSATTKLFAMLLLVVSTGFQQGQHKVIEWGGYPIHSKSATAADIRPFGRIDGVEIQDIVVGGHAITIGQGFPSNDDWLQTITFRVKNTSQQHLKSVQITVVLPELGPGGPNIVFCHGCAKSESDGIMPGEEVELKILGGGHYEWVTKRVAEKSDMSKIDRAHIETTFVVLPDGTKWFSGCVKTVNPKNACVPYEK